MYLQYLGVSSNLNLSTHIWLDIYYLSADNPPLSPEDYHIDLYLSLPPPYHFTHPPTYTYHHSYSEPHELLSSPLPD